MIIIVSRINSDYSMLFYVLDGFLFLTILIVAFKMDLRVDRQDVKNESIFIVLATIWSIPMAIYLIGIIITGQRQTLIIPWYIFCSHFIDAGMFWGIHSGFLTIYLQRDLGASSQLLAYAIMLSSVCVMVVMPFAEKFVNLIGIYLHFDPQIVKMHAFYKIFFLQVKSIVCS